MSDSGTASLDAPAPDRSSPTVPDLHEEQSRRQVPGFLLSGGVLVALLVTWQVVVRALDVPIVLVPAPTDVWQSLVEGLLDGDLLSHAWVTLKEILVGFALAVLAALACAFLITQSRILDKALFPLVVMTQTIPKVAMAPLLVVWFGTGMTSKVLTTATIAFFPLLINAILGLRSADPEQIDMLRSFGATRIQVLRKLQVPSALPHIFAGLDVAVVLSVTGTIVAEFVGATAGLGYVIQATNFSLDVSRTFAVLVILSAIGLALHATVTFANRKIVFWSAEHHTVTEQA